MGALKGRHRANLGRLSTPPRRVFGWELRAPNSQTLRPLVHLNRTRDPSTGFDLDLPVGDRAGNVTTGADQQPLVDDEITLDAATYVSIFRRPVASEDAGLGDNHVLAVLQIHFDSTLDDELVAGCNIARK